MDNSWYIAPKMGCFRTLPSPWNRAGKRILRIFGNPQTQNFLPAPNMVGPPGDTISRK